jgi:pilus assembly protein TadC
MKKEMRKIFRESDYNDIEKKLSMLPKTKLNSEKFLIIRFILTLVTFIILLFTSDLGYITSPLGALLIYYLTTYILILKPLRQRVEKLDFEALDFFEVLTLSLESGHNLEQAIEITTKTVKSELSDEFDKALFEMKFGKSLNEALDSLRNKMPSMTINNIILDLEQTSMYGSDIVLCMNNQIDFLRDKKILKIKEKINKLPNQISIISVVFIIPLLLTLILGPFFINFFMK